jgi:aryl-alcohol dehydrogenase-like predicted oxidoreductase
MKPTEVAIDGSKANIQRSIDECLRVLDGKKFLDIFECSRVDPEVPVEDTISYIAEYVKAGKIGGISMSEVSAKSIRKGHAVHPIAAVEVEFSMYATEILENDVASTCAELGIPIIAYSPMGRGFLVSIAYATSRDLLTRSRTANTRSSTTSSPTRCSVTSRASSLMSLTRTSSWQTQSQTWRSRRASHQPRSHSAGCCTTARSRACLLLSPFPVPARLRGSRRTRSRQRSAKRSSSHYRRS